MVEDEVLATSLAEAHRTEGASGADGGASGATE